MKWAVVYTKKNNVMKEDFLERYTYSEERANELAEKYNSESSDKEYRAKLCEALY